MKNLIAFSAGFFLVYLYTSPRATQEHRRQMEDMPNVYKRKRKKVHIAGIEEIIEPYEFIYDEHNIKHLLFDYPDRKNTIEEIESVFSDPNKKIKEQQIDRFGKISYICFGVSNKNRRIGVCFNMIKGKIRPFTCYSKRK